MIALLVAGIVIVAGVAAVVCMSIADEALRTGDWRRAQANTIGAVALFAAGFALSIALIFIPSPIPVF